MEHRSGETVPDDARIRRTELFDLHEHYESVITEQLDFFFKYLNFYIGLLSAILAGTLTGLLSFEAPYPLGYTLALGPLLIVVLSVIGYSNVRVFYRRFIEAWVTVLNIQAMLGLNENMALQEGLRPPLYRSRHGGGFITQFERPVIRAVLDRAAKEERPAEEVLEEVLKRGDTLRYAKITFAGFAIVAVLLLMVVILTVA